MNYNKIRELLTDKDFGFSQLAEKIGMSRGGLYTAIEKETLTISSLENIAKVLDVPISVFFENEEGFFSSVSDFEKLKTEIEKLRQSIFERDEKIIELKAVGRYIKAHYEYIELKLRKSVEYRWKYGKPFSNENFMDNFQEIDAMVYSDPDIIKLQKEKDEFMRVFALGKLDYDISSIISE